MFNSRNKVEEFNKITLLGINYATHKLKRFDSNGVLLSYP